MHISIYIVLLIITKLKIWFPSGQTTQCQYYKHTHIIKRWKTYFLLLWHLYVLDVGPFQTSYLSCVEYNANEQNPLFELICIRFDTWKVRRLNWGYQMAQSVACCMQLWMHAGELGKARKERDCLTLDLSQPSNCIHYSMERAKPWTIFFIS